MRYRIEFRDKNEAREYARIIKPYGTVATRNSTVLAEGIELSVLEMKLVKIVSGTKNTRKPRIEEI